MTKRKDSDIAIEDDAIVALPDAEAESELSRLRRRDQTVRSHEDAHRAAAGVHAGPPEYAYETGPDGRQYVVDGKVPVHMPAAHSSPQTRLQAAEAISAAAKAVDKASGPDLQLLRRADEMAEQAALELAGVPVAPTKAGAGPAASRTRTSPGKDTPRLPHTADAFSAPDSPSTDEKLAGLKESDQLTLMVQDASVRDAVIEGRGGNADLKGHLQDLAADKAALDKVGKAMAADSLRDSQKAYHELKQQVTNADEAIKNAGNVEVQVQGQGQGQENKTVKVSTIAEHRDQMQAIVDNTGNSEEDRNKAKAEIAEIDKAYDTQLDDYAGAVAKAQKKKAAAQAGQNMLKAHANASKQEATEKKVEQAEQAQQEAKQQRIQAADDLSKNITQAAVTSDQVMGREDAGFLRTKIGEAAAQVDPRGKEMANRLTDEDVGVITSVAQSLEKTGRVDEATKKELRKRAALEGEKGISAKVSLQMIDTMEKGDKATGKTKRQTKAMDDLSADAAKVAEADGSTAKQRIQKSAGRVSKGLAEAAGKLSETDAEKVADFAQSLEAGEIDAKTIRSWQQQARKKGKGADSARASLQLAESMLEGDKAARKAPRISEQDSANQVTSSYNMQNNSLVNDFTGGRARGGRENAVMGEVKVLLERLLEEFSKLAGDLKGSI